MSLTPPLRRGAIIIALALAIPFVRVAGSWALDLLNEGWATLQHARHDALVARAPRPLPVRAEDYRRYPREGFGLVLEDDYGNRLDTFAGTCTKDLIAHPDTTFAMVLPPAGLDSIYDAMIRIRFFDPEERFPAVRVYRSVEPDAIRRLRARAGSAERQLVWDTGAWVDGPTTDDGKRLLALLRLIHRRIEARPEYQKLPRPAGGYD